MNFRHPFELGLAQFSSIQLFEVGRGVFYTRPEAKFALVLQECDILFFFLLALKTGGTEKKKNN